MFCKYFNLYPVTWQMLLKKYINVSTNMLIE